MQLHAQYPWDIPVPVRAGGFLSVFSKHEHCNVVAAPGRIGAFGARQRLVPSERLLFADQQITPFLQVSGRLGSGRSGVYQGLYLKGIGRTPLAGNWNSSDLNHNTGHLTASSAIRELVISAYVRAVGGEESIVPCQGVLLRPLSSKLARFRALMVEDFPEETLPAADGVIQAITVKPGSFARISNFAWLLHHLTPRCVQQGQTSVARFAQLLSAALVEPWCGSNSDLQKISPRTLVAQLESAVAQACRHFGLWMREGIWWGSFGNNFTVDGRFLDLETPSVSGGPLLGRFSSEGVVAGRIRRSSVIGTEIFFYLTQMQRFCRLAVQSLSYLPSLFHPIEKEFSRALAEEIEFRLLGDDSVLGSRERAVELALDLHKGAAPSLSRAALRKLREILEAEYDWIAGDGIYSGHSRDLEQAIPLSIPPIISEAGVKWRFHALRLAGDEAILPTTEAQERAWGLHALIAELDATTDVDELLIKLTETERRVQALVACCGSSPSVPSFQRCPAMTPQDKGASYGTDSVHPKPHS